MSELSELKDELDRLEVNKDYTAMAALRERIVAEHSESEEAVEALYKLGLHSLFYERALGPATERFELAAKKKHEYWSAAARTSLGICYYHQGRGQKALFELRRVGYSEVPTEHTITALSFMETIHANEAEEEEMVRVRQERIKQLRSLIADMRSEPSVDFGQYLFSLAAALHDEGDHDDASAALGEAQKLGPEVLGAELYQAVASGFS